MSERYETRLVEKATTTYEQGAIGVTAGSFAAFALAAGSLFGWVPISGTVGGVAGATYFGAGLIGLGAATAGLGAYSRWGNIQTTPDRSAGFVVGALQAVVWTIAVGLLAGTTVSLGRIGWLVALPAGLGAGYATVAQREDVGATLPTAALVTLLGLIFLTGFISPTWTWEPDGFAATIPGTLVVPLLTMFASLLTGWASAAAYEGFGTRGRQNGAFVLISLVVLLTLSVLVFLLVFVFERGIMVVLENLRVSAGTMLAGLGATLFLLRRAVTIDPRAADGTDKIIAFVSLAVTVVLALLGAALVGAVATSSEIAGYSVTVAPTAVVGAGPGLLAGGLVLLLTRAGADWRPESDRERLIRRGFRLLLVAVALVTLVEFLLGTPLAAGGVSAVTVLVAAGGLAALALAGVHLTGERAGDASTAVPPVPWLARAALLLAVLACVRVFLTGAPVGASQIGITGGTVDWPFVTNASQGLGIQRGVMPAMFGTIWIVLGAVVFAVPLAVGSAVFLTEYAEDSVFTSAVDIATNGLWSTPSIVFGLFGLAFLVPRLGGSPSILASQLVLGFMLLPLVLITSREAMKSVPDEYRDASAALGVSKWQTVRSVVVPAAMPGVVTGVILGVGRIAGETAPLLLVLNGPVTPTSGPSILSGFVVRVTASPPFVHVSNPALLDRASALPYQLYAIITAGVSGKEAFGWGTALVLLGVVLGFFAMSIATRRYFRRKLHQ